MSTPELFIQPPLETLATVLHGPVLHVTLNRPEVRNAMSLAMVTELWWVLAQAESGGKVRAIVLRGAGGHFCAGADLKDMAVARVAAMQAGAPVGVPNATAAPNAIAAANAQVLGLVHEVHGSDRIDAALARVLADILTCAPSAVAQTKALLIRARFTPGAQLVSDAADVFAGAAQGPEGLEGIDAYVQKRKPDWVTP